jgi:hypothetical protein
MIDNMKLAEIELTVENSMKDPKFKNNKALQHMTYLLQVIREQNKKLEYCSKHHTEAGD